MRNKNFFEINRHWTYYGSNAKFTCDVLFPDGKIIKNTLLQNFTSTIGITIKIHGWESFISGGQVEELKFRFIAISKGSRILFSKVIRDGSSEQNIGVLVDNIVPGNPIKVRQDNGKILTLGHVINATDRPIHCKNVPDRIHVSIKTLDQSYETYQFELVKE